MAGFNSISKRAKNALKAIMEDVTYDAGNGDEPAFVKVVGSTEGVFDAYPVLRIFPGRLDPQKVATAEDDRTLAFTMRVLLPLEETVEASEATYDYMYDLTDLIVDTLNRGDFQGVLTAQDPTLPTWMLSATTADWMVAVTKAGAMLACDVNVEVKYSIQWA